MMQKFLLLLFSCGYFSMSKYFFIFAFFFSCSKGPTFEGYQFTPIKDSSYKGLLFTAHKEHQSSILYWYDFSTGKVELVSEGQSGDPKLFLLENEIYFFNRSAPQINYFVLESKYPFKTLSETTPSALTPGDPHSSLKINDKKALLSCPWESKIKILHLDSGKIEDFYEDLNEPNFSPGGLIMRKGPSGDKYVYTLSLGVDKSFQAQDLQKLYKLQLGNKNLSLTSKVKTNQTFSHSLLEDPLDESTLHALSLGYKDIPGQKTAYDSISLFPVLTVSKSDDLTILQKFYKFGEALITKTSNFLIPLKEKSTSFIQVESLSFSGGSPQLKTLHTANPKTSSVNMTYDHSNDCVFIGESEYQKNGKIHFYCQGNKVFTETIDLSYYEGVLIP